MATTVSPEFEIDPDQLINDMDTLRSEVNELRKENVSLRERINKLENTTNPKCCVIQ